MSEVPQHHAVGACPGVQAVHVVLHPGGTLEAQAVRGLRYLWNRGRRLNAPDQPPNPIKAIITGRATMMRMAPRMSNEKPVRIIVVIRTAPDP